MIELLFLPEVWASLVTLVIMETVLGIDNIIFISVLVERLEPAQSERARKIGIFLALVFRILLLTIIAWIVGLTQPLFELFNHAFSWRDFILIIGGGFLLYKATHEIHLSMEGDADEGKKTGGGTFFAVISQIVVIDLVFSIDSIVTAVGMADHVEVMIAAVIISMIGMYFASGPIARFIKLHPTTKMLALSFLFLIGMALIADGFGFHIPKGYIYFAMAFAALVEFINIAVRHVNQKRLRRNL